MGMGAAGGDGGWRGRVTAAGGSCCICDAAAGGIMLEASISCMLLLFPARHSRCGCRRAATHRRPCCIPPTYSRPACRLADHADCADRDLHLCGHRGADSVPGGAVRLLRVRAVRQPHHPCCRGEDPGAGGRRGLPGVLLGHERCHYCELPVRLAVGGCLLDGCC